MPKVNIVIVSFNTRSSLMTCLKSLQENPPTISHDIIVVDNASSDGTPEALQTHWPEIRLLKLDKNLGFAAATNEGMRRTSGELVLLLNSDTIVPMGSIDNLVVALTSNPDVAIAGPRLLSRDGKLELSFGSMISPISEIRQKLLQWSLNSKVRILSNWVEKRARYPHHPDWVSGACLLVRRYDAEAVGLLDERFFLYTEDVDFCWAVRNKNRLVLFTPNSEIVHDRGRSREFDPKTAHSAYRQSHFAFYKKHHPFWVPMLRLYLKLQGTLVDSN